MLTYLQLPIYNLTTLFLYLDGNEEQDEEFRTPPSSAYQHTFRTPEIQKKSAVSSDSSDEESSSYLTPQPPTFVQVGSENNKRITDF